MTTEQDFTNDLYDFLASHDVNSDSDKCAGWPGPTTDIKSVRTFEDLGMLARNSGLVVTMTNGSQFHITVVKSR